MQLSIHLGCTSSEVDTLERAFRPTQDRRHINAGPPEVAPHYLAAKRTLTGWPTMPVNVR